MKSGDRSPELPEDPEGPEDREPGEDPSDQAWQLPPLPAHAPLLVPSDWAQDIEERLSRLEISTHPAQKRNTLSFARAEFAAQVSELRDELRTLRGLVEEAALEARRANDWITERVSREMRQSTDAGEVESEYHTEHARTAAMYEDLVHQSVRKLVQFKLCPGECPTGAPVRCRAEVAAHLVRQLFGSPSSSGTDPVRLLESLRHCEHGGHLNPVAAQEPLLTRLCGTALEIVHRMNSGPVRAVLDFEQDPAALMPQAFRNWSGPEDGRPLLLVAPAYLVDKRPPYTKPWVFTTPRAGAGWSGADQ